MLRRPVEVAVISGRSVAYHANGCFRADSGRLVLIGRRPLSDREVRHRLRKPRITTTESASIVRLSHR